ncbi:MAG TPA: hypothetical protein VGK73_16330 [Polyangiaceae bacterium]
MPALFACAVAPGDADDEAASELELGVRIVDPGPSEVLRPFPPPDFDWPRPPRLDPEELLDITAGGYHTCVRKRNGNVYCWGLDDAGQAGMLPTATCVSAPNACVDRPRRVGGSTFTATQIDAGFDHTCTLDSTGKAYCWGRSGYGQLGAGIYGSLASPIAVSGNLTFTSISAGVYSSCGTTAGNLYCWGMSVPGTSSYLGAASTPAVSYSPTGLAPVGVSVGYLHVCAQWVSGSFRETNCWGGNSFGQSGSTPSSFATLGMGPSSVGTTATRVTTQNNFTCVDQPAPNTSVQCFGENGWGQLGNGTFTNASSAQTVGGNLALHGVSTGLNHACALDANGAAYCWGNGYWGQLGHGASAVSATPVPVSGGIAFKAIAAGYFHTCGLSTANKIHCWGSNYTGQLGTQYKSPNQTVSPPYTNGWVSTPVQALDPT